MDFTQWCQDKPVCEDCRAFHAKKDREAPCETCEEKLLEENEEASRIFFLSQNQVIVIGEHLELNVLAIKVLMDLYKVKDQRACLEKVLKLNNSLKSLRK
jgi:hypothetical protein